MAYWLATIDAHRIREEARPEILRYQRQAADVLYQWVQSVHALPAPGESPQARLPEPDRSTNAVIIQQEPGAGTVMLAPVESPGPDASHADVAAYHEQMALWHRWQADHHMQQWRGEVEEWRGSVEARLESDKETLKLFSELMDRLGPEKISTEQQTTIRGMVQRLHELTGVHQQTIYWQLSQAFQVPRYRELSERQYPSVVEWLRQRIEDAKVPKKPRKEKS